MITLLLRCPAMIQVQENVLMLKPNSGVSNIFW